MKTEEALTEVEVPEVGLRVDPGNVAVLVFDTVAGVVVVEHYLARADGRDFISEHGFEGESGVEAFAQPDVEIVEAGKLKGLQVYRENASFASGSMLDYEYDQ